VTELTDRFAEAFEYSNGMHRGQTRKIHETPYISHPMAVASIVLEGGGDEDEAIAALLHDVIEDCGGRPREEEIRSRFGDRVADLVVAVTDAWESPKPPWQERKDATIEHLKTADPSVRLLKSADLLCNIRSLMTEYLERGEAVWQHFRAGCERTLWYYRAAAAAIRQAGGSPSLVLVEAEIKRFEQIITAEVEKIALAETGK